MLTRPRRQVLATLAVLFATVVPTLFVAATAFRVSRPGHLREVEAEIGRRLGVLVEVASASHPRPGEDVLRGVILRLDPDERSEFARADSLAIVRDGRELALSAHHLTIRGDAPSNALAQMVGLLRRAGSADSDRMSLAADGVTVGLGDSRFEFRDLAAIFQVDRGTPTITASYIFVDSRTNAKTRCELVLSRDRGEGGARTSLGFRTIEGPLPARLLGPFFDAPNWLGNAAMVEGSLQMSQLREGAWEAVFRGELSNVDLSTLVLRRFAGHRLSGLARVVFEEARWADRPGGQGPGWTAARGSLLAGQGSISGGLLKGMASEMKFRLASPPDPRRPDVEFQNLGLSFALDASGELMLGGSLGGDYAPDAVIVAGHRAMPLAKAPEGAANVRGLWKTLIAAPADAMAPAIPEAQVLRYLPLPRASVGRLRTN